jgi:hypothetical protein
MTMIVMKRILLSTMRRECDIQAVMLDTWLPLRIGSIIWRLRTWCNNAPRTSSGKT